MVCRLLHVRHTRSVKFLHVIDLLYFCQGRENYID